MCDRKGLTNSYRPHPLMIDGVRHHPECEALHTPAWHVQRRACTCGAADVGRCSQALRDPAVSVLAVHIKSVEVAPCRDSVSGRAWTFTYNDGGKIFTTDADRARQIIEDSGLAATG